MKKYIYFHPKGEIWDATTFSMRATTASGPKPSELM
jgi:hypothetical protein